MPVFLRAPSVPRGRRGFYRPAYCDGQSFHRLGIHIVQGKICSNFAVSSSTGIDLKRLLAIISAPEFLDHSNRLAGERVPNLALQTLLAMLSRIENSIIDIIQECSGI